MNTDSESGSDSGSEMNPFASGSEMNPFASGSEMSQFAMTLPVSHGLESRLSHEGMDRRHDVPLRNAHSMGDFPDHHSVLPHSMRIWHSGSDTGSLDDSEDFEDDNLGGRPRNDLSVDSDKLPAGMDAAPHDCPNTHPAEVQCIIQELQAAANHHSGSSDEFAEFRTTAVGCCLDLLHEEELASAEMLLEPCRFEYNKLGELLGRYAASIPLQENIQNYCEEQAAQLKYSELIHAESPEAASEYQSLLPSTMKQLSDQHHVGQQSAMELKKQVWSLKDELTNLSQTCEAHGALKESKEAISNRLDSLLHELRDTAESHGAVVEELDKRQAAEKRLQEKKLQEEQEEAEQSPKEDFHGPLDNDCSQVDSPSNLQKARPSKTFALPAAPIETEMNYEACPSHTFALPAAPIQIEMNYEGADPTLLQSQARQARPCEVVRWVKVDNNLVTPTARASSRSRANSNVMSTPQASTLGQMHGETNSNVMSTPRASTLGQMQGKVMPSDNLNQPGDLEVRTLPVVGIVGRGGSAIRQSHDTSGVKISANKLIGSETGADQLVVNSDREDIARGPSQREIEIEKVRIHLQSILHQSLEDRGQKNTVSEINETQLKNASPTEDDSSPRTVILDVDEMQHQDMPSSAGVHQSPQQGSSHLIQPVASSLAHQANPSLSQRSSRNQGLDDPAVQQASLVMFMDDDLDGPVVQRVSLAQHRHEGRDLVCWSIVILAILVLCGGVLAIYICRLSFEADLAQHHHCQGNHNNPQICESCGSGILLPLGGKMEQSWSKPLRAVMYFICLLWCFSGISIVCEQFMDAIQEITGQEVLVHGADDHGIPRKVNFRIWNPTMANLTLMALGSSAPEILLNVVEIVGMDFFSGELGPSTIVGSAAFNLLVISAVCISAVPAPETRKVEQTGVFGITATFSVLAYIWLIFILQVSTPEKVDIWEALITLMLLPLLLVISFAADKGWILSWLQCEQDYEVGSGAKDRLDLDDGQGVYFEKSQMIVPLDSMSIRIPIRCAETSSCPILRFETQDQTARAGEDYRPIRGELRFTVGMCLAELQVNMLKQPWQRREDRSFLMLLTMSGEVTRFTATCKVIIPSEPAQLEGGWLEQFTRAVYCNGSRKEQRQADLQDWFTHIAAFYWKVLFACIAPVHIFGGWLCFWMSLFAIGAVTALVSDLANLLGCCLGIPGSVTAITLVALGTSVPDTFASRTAAVQECTADNSIGNITGSNAVNVFLGLGLPWAIGAIYWKVKGRTPEWQSRRLNGKTLQEQYGTRYPDGGLIIPAGSLTVSVAVFTGAAMMCVALLLWRRRVYGGELGGPRNAQKRDSFVLLLLWIVYVTTCVLYSMLTQK